MYSEDSQKIAKQFAKSLSFGRNGKVSQEDVDAYKKYAEQNGIKVDFSDIEKEIEDQTKKVTKDISK